MTRLISVKTVTLCDNHNKRLVADFYKPWADTTKRVPGSKSRPSVNEDLGKKRRGNGRVKEGSGSRVLGPKKWADPPRSDDRGGREDEAKPSTPQVEEAANQRKAVPVNQSLPEFTSSLVQRLECS